MKITKNLLYVFYAVTGVALLLTVGLSVYRYSKSGEFDFTSLIPVAGLLVAAYVVKVSTKIEE